MLINIAHSPSPNEGLAFTKQISNKIFTPNDIIDIILPETSRTRMIVWYKQQDKLHLFSVTKAIHTISPRQSYAMNSFLCSSTHLQKNSISLFLCSLAPNLVRTSFGNITNPFNCIVPTLLPYLHSPYSSAAVL